MHEQCCAPELDARIVAAFNVHEQFCAFPMTQTAWQREPAAAVFVSKRFSNRAEWGWGILAALAGAASPPSPPPPPPVVQLLHHAGLHAAVAR